MATVCLKGMDTYAQPLLVAVPNDHASSPTGNWCGGHAISNSQPALLPAANCTGRVGACGISTKNDRPV